VSIAVQGARKWETMTISPEHPSDPMPQAPEQPDINACCGNGCDPCIFDLHDLAMHEYRRALNSWHARQEVPPSSNG
jgi:hypothetical protein